MIGQVTRRNVLTGVTGMSLLAMAGPSTVSVATASGHLDLDLNDPKVRSEVYAKIYATTEEADVHKYWTVHYYAYLHEGGNMVPLNTMLNYNYSRWKPVGDNRYEGTAWEVGVYTDFDGDTIYDETWINPITGDELPIAHFKGGPWPEAVGPDGIAQTARGADVLQEMKIRVIGNIVWVPTAANYNLEFPGNPPSTFTWDSYFNYSASVADVLNPDMPSVPFTGALHNLSDWQPGIGMENHAGRSFGRAPGQKIFSIDELPELAKVAFNRHTPDIFDVDNWQPPRFG